MTAVRDVYVYCDGCEGAGEMKGAYGVGAGYATFKDLRAAASQFDGWVHRRGKDYCQECVSEGRA